MTDSSLTIIVVQGTVRDGRKSIHPARYVTDRFQENGHKAELMDTDTGRAQDREGTEQ